MKCNVKGKLIGERIGKASDFPDCLVVNIPEFSSSRNVFDSQVLNVLKEELGGVASLSELVVWGYIRYGIEEKTRKEYLDSVYRLIRKKRVLKRYGSKGIYEINIKEEK